MPKVRGHEAEAGPARQTARGTLQIMIGHGFQLICGYIIIVVLARVLGPEDYGVYGVIMSVLLWVEFSSTLGIPQTMAKLIPESGADAHRLEQTVVGLTLGISLFVFALFILAAPIVANLFKMSGTAPLFRLAAVDIPFFTLYCVGSEILGGRRQFTLVSSRLIIYAGAKLLGILVLALGGLTVASALIAHAFASAVAVLFMLMYISAKNV
ncbi:MAG: oligosaccharide flippase family protein, partial [Desulfobacterales bacterium]